MTNPQFSCRKPVFLPFLLKNCEHFSIKFIRNDLDNNKKIEGEKNRLIDVITMVLTGIGGGALAFAFFDYRLSHKKISKAEEIS